MNVTEALYDEEIGTFIDVIYYVIIFTGLLFNGYVCYLVSTNKVQLSPFMILMFNICIADIVAAISTLPDLAIDLNKLDTPVNTTVGKFLCIFTYGKGIRFCALGVQIFTISLSNVNRYLMTKSINTEEFKMSVTDAKRFAGVIWISTFFLTLPFSLPMKYDFRGKICYRDWNSFNPSFALLYKAIVFGLGFFLPGFVMVTMIFLSIRNTSRIMKLPSTNGNCIEMQRKIERARNEVWGYLVPLMISFFTCLGPLSVYFFITSFVIPSFDDKILWHRRNQEYVKIMNIFSTLTVITDPVIYLWKSRRRNRNEIIPVPVLPAVNLNSETISRGVNQS